MMKRGTRVLVDGRPGVIKGSWRRPLFPGSTRAGVVMRRVRLDDGQIVYVREEQLEQVR
jgi:hypothetical protein